MSGPPKECPECGNTDIEIKRDTGLYKWNRACFECMNGDYKFYE